MNYFYQDQFIQFTTEDKTIKVFNVTSDTTIDIDIPTTVLGKVTCLTCFKYFDYLYVCFGTTKGQIFQVNLNKGNFSNAGQPIVSSPQFGQIRSLAIWSPSSNSKNQSKPLLYCSSEDKTIRIISISDYDSQKKKNSGSSHILDKLYFNVEKLSINDQGSFLAAADASIKLIELVSKKEVVTFSTHINNIVSLKFRRNPFKNSDVLLSCSNDRVVYLWDCSPESNYGNGKPIQEFACSEFPIFIDYQFISKEKYIFISISKYLEIWTNDPQEKEKNSLTFQLTIPKQILILNSGLSVVSSSAVYLLLAYESSFKLFFEKINLLQGEKLRPDLKKTIQNLEKKVTTSSKTPTILSSLPPTKKLNASVSSGTVVTTVTENQKKKKEDLSMEEIMKSQQNESSLKGSLSVDSIQSVLITAIQSEDLQLLQKSLSIIPHVVKNTVEQLPIPYINNLLPLLVTLFKETPSTGEEVFLWIQSILTTHSSYLLSNPHFSQSISELYVLLEERTSHYSDILRLEGRLELIRSNISKRTTHLQKKEAILTDETQILSDDDLESESSFEDEDSSENEEEEEEDESSENEEDKSSMSEG